MRRLHTASLKAAAAALLTGLLLACSSTPTYNPTTFPYQIDAARLADKPVKSVVIVHVNLGEQARNYLEKELKVDEPARNRWAQNWIVEGLKAVESHLANEPETGRYCHGDTPTIADICVVSQVFGAQFFKADTSGVPTVMRVFNECMKLEAFDRG